MVKQGEIARLDIINLEQVPEAAQQYAVRSVPRIQIGDFIFEGQQSPQAIREWIARAGSDQGERDYLETQLGSGNVQEALSYLRAHPQAMNHIVSLMDDADAKINLKLGIGVVFEEFAKTPLVEPVIDMLKARLKHADARVRADACYYLSLTEDASLRPSFEQCLQDGNADVREIAAEALESLPQTH